MERKNLRSFDLIREVTEHIYTYGFFSREDFIQSGKVGSPRAYDDIIRQLRDLFFLDMDKEESVLEEDTYKRGKYKCYKFKRNYFLNQSERLAAIYGLHAIKDEGIVNSILCLATATSKDGATIENIVSCLPDDENGTDFSPTIRRRLDSLKKAGYIICKERKYYLHNEIVSLSNEELIQLYYLAAYYAGAGYPRIPAVFLKKALGRQIAFRNLPYPPELFLFKENNCGNVLDEQIIYEIVHACKSQSVIEVTYIRTNAKAEVKPVFLKCDKRMGRWYLFAVCGDTPQVMRVSNIRQIKALNQCFNYDEERKKVESYYVFNYISGRRTEKPVRVEAELLFDNSFMKEQFIREMPTGYIKESDGVELYCAEVNDVSELKPFLRCFGANLRILPSVEHQLDKEILKGFERMLERYETI